MRPRCGCRRPCRSKCGAGAAGDWIGCTVIQQRCSPRFDRDVSEAAITRYVRNRPNTVRERRTMRCVCLDQPTPGSRRWPPHSFHAKHLGEDQRFTHIEATATRTTRLAEELRSLASAARAADDRTPKARGVSQNFGGCVSAACRPLILLKFLTDGAPGGTRTPTPLREPDFESGASTGSATGASAQSGAS
jgi:hypothetical protein